MPRRPPSDAETDGRSDCVQRAYLYFVKDIDTGGPPYSTEDLDLMAFDPGEVTRLAGLQPTEAWRRGDARAGRPDPQRFSNWTYELPETRTYVTEEVVTRLLDEIEPHAGGIAEACTALGLRAGINVVIEMSGVRDAEDGEVILSTAAVTYTSETLKRLARLNVSVDHDQYVILPGRHPGH
ncbi:hypothetical protein Aph02nite_84130 [Actinoplanes philippinensis]|uniref:DUF4279 domain-containing protein n=1 Tax=Actinoplanes philippinensis TaxID=35752 RepID=A0A1I2L6V9_9ACTN|nr:DUF4279 domain-containing protein [Actinoplanes philippinensis]GIE82463.1 hypothetical protein Aph02nite_84130 [Actinoplanes philippinensis]SFF74288.1 protein of unknown function [Actinoplanes philippinensis]